MKALIIILMTLGIIGCKKSSERTCFKGIGDVITYEREANSFNDIQLNDFVDLIVVWDSVHSINITTGENLIEFIGTEISNNKLVITDGNKCDFLRDMNFRSVITVGTPDLSTLEVYGSGDVEIRHDSLGSFRLKSEDWNGKATIDIECDSISTDILGSPRMTFKGTTDFAFFYMFGNSNQDASELNVSKCILNWNSTGELKINSNGEVYGEIFSSGDVINKSSAINSITSYGTGSYIQP